MEFMGKYNKHLHTKLLSENFQFFLRRKLSIGRTSEGRPRHKWEDIIRCTLTLGLLILCKIEPFLFCEFKKKREFTVSLLVNNSLKVSEKNEKSSSENAKSLSTPPSVGERKRESINVEGYLRREPN